MVFNDLPYQDNHIQYIATNFETRRAARQLFLETSSSTVNTSFSSGQWIEKNNIRYTGVVVNAVAI